MVGVTCHYASFISPTAIAVVTPDKNAASCKAVKRNGQQQTQLLKQRIAGDNEDDKTKTAICATKMQQCIPGRK